MLIYYCGSHLFIELNFKLNLYSFINFYTNLGVRAFPFCHLNFEIKQKTQEELHYYFHELMQYFQFSFL